MEVTKAQGGSVSCSLEMRRRNQGKSGQVRAFLPSFPPIKKVAFILLSCIVAEGFPWEFSGAPHSIAWLRKRTGRRPTESSKGVPLSSTSPFRIQSLSVLRAVLALRGRPTLIKLVRLMGEVRRFVY